MNFFPVASNKQLKIFKDKDAAVFCLWGLVMIISLLILFKLKTKSEGQWDDSMGKVTCCWSLTTRVQSLELM